MKKFKYLIIGGGVAGTTAAETIRQNDAAGSIAIISDEPHPFYSRVMLSKPNFYRENGEQQIWLKTPNWYVKENIELINGQKAANLDADKKIVGVENGEEIEYEKLLIAIGSCARKWPVKGGEKKGVFSLRNLDDALEIKEALKTAKSGVLIGGGFISFEMCDILRSFSLETNLILRESYYWEPVLDKNEGQLVENALVQGGVKILHNAEVNEVIGDDSVQGVILKDGTQISCDLVIAGIGVFCPLEWLKNSGLQVDKGIFVSEYLETNLTCVWAAGDATELNDLVLEERVQLGNWLNAQMQGKVAGLNMAGKKEPLRAVSSYSTTGFKISISFVGDVRPGADREMISRGTLESGSCGRLIIKDGEIIGATLINRTFELSKISKLIETDFKVSSHEKELADPNFDLTKLI